MFGNNHFLFGSAYFWLCLPLTVCLALAPRYLAKALKFGFAPDDIDIMRYIRKQSRDRNIVNEVFFRGSPAQPQRGDRRASVLSRSTYRTGSTVSLPAQASVDHRSASRTDMSTGLRTVYRGFDFSIEEDGVAVQRMQTNLSERRQSNRNLASPARSWGRSTRGSHLFSVRPGFLRKKASRKENND